MEWPYKTSLMYKVPLEFEQDEADSDVSDTSTIETIEVEDIDPTAIEVKDGPETSSKVESSGKMNSFRLDDSRSS